MKRTPSRLILKANSSARSRRFQAITVAVILALIIGALLVYRESKSATCCTNTLHASSRATVNGPLVYINKDALQHSALSFDQHAKLTSQYVAQVVKKADQLASQSIQTVTAKSQTPAGGTKNDYYSLADYWWPDTSSISGQPYVRRDGHVNPETKTIPDKQNFNTMLNVINNSSLAYYYTGQDKYAQKTAAEIKAWFINPATRMNPNLNYAQVIKGRPNDGTGLIDLRYLPQVLDAATLISPSPAMSATDIATVHTWSTQYTDWLTTSSPGMTQATTTNNHATWYDAQLIALGSYLQNNDLASKYASHVTELIGSQIKADGSQPYELARTRSWDYSILNLEALLVASVAAKNTHVDVLTYTSKTGSSIKQAIEYLTPYVSDKKWPYQQISKFDASRIATVLTMADQLYNDNFNVPKHSLIKLGPDSTVALANDLTD